MILITKKLENMKNIKTLLIILLGFIGYTALGSDTLYVRFNNYFVKDGPTNDTLIFDVEYKSFTTGTYLVACQIDISYNTAVFGLNALPVSVQNLSLIGAALTINVGPTNPANNRFRYAVTQLLPPYNPANLSLVPTTTFGGVLRFKMLILDNTQPAGMQFILAGGMTGTQKFVKIFTSTASTYAPVVAKNDLLNLPTTPTIFNLLISEVADPTGSNADFVEIHNPGASAVDFSIFPWYLTVWDGASYSNVKLTGSIAAGDSYIIGGTFYSGGFPSIPADITSGIVTGGGTLYHYLTTYGPYTEGMFIDYYGGVGSTYTGMHAVRHYSVVVPSTTFNASEWVISTAQDVDMTPGSQRLTFTWDGSSSTDWHTQANWSSDLIPDAGQNVVIPNNGITPIIGFGDNAYMNDLTINSGANLIVDSQNGVGDGSIITYGTVTGNATVKRYIGADRYYYISQPVTTAVAGVFLHTWMFTYNELTGAWGSFIEPPATALNVMKGYAVWSSSINSYDPGVPPIGDTTVAYTGVLNSGSNSVALTFTNVGSVYGDGWNFVGNCYASASDWEAVGWTKTNLQTNAYSVWNGTTYGTYTVGSGGTNGATKYIPAAQGYFVKVTAAGSLGVTDAVRAHSTQAFWKSEGTMENRLSLTVTNGEVNDETVIFFNSNATTAMDYDYDASKLLAPAAPQIYTMLGTDRMAINTYNNTTETNSVKLGVNAPVAGEYLINVSNIESFDVNTPIFLEDLLTGQVINLRENSSYSFNADEGTSECFLVHFSEVQGIDDPSKTGITSIYTNNGKIYVDYNGSNGEISIFNILGQELSMSNANNGLNIISVPQGNAVYIVKVISETTTVTKKVFVK